VQNEPHTRVTRKAAPFHHRATGCHVDIRCSYALLDSKYCHVPVPSWWPFNTVLWVLLRYPLDKFSKFGTAPAEVALENEVKAFTAGREHKTIYQGLSDDVDRAWGDLYNSKPWSNPSRQNVESSIDTIMKIPKSEAALLPNKTYPIKDEPGYYLAGLDVLSPASLSR
jgi:hypothetical protein